MRSATPGRERRHHPRLPTGGRIQCDLLVLGLRHRFYVDEMSRGGMKVRSADEALYERLEAGTVLTVLAVGNGHNFLEEERSGEIIWTAAVDGRFLAGIRFLEPLAELDRLGILEPEQ